MSESIMPAEAAALLVASLERRGAVFVLDDEGYLRADLNGIPGLDYKRAERLSHAILSLHDDIKAMLHARRVQH